MAENDLSKIVNLIMENPKLIEEIKNLGAVGEEKKETAEREALKVEEKNDEPITEKASGTDTKNASRTRRRDLLAAIKPYVSEERSKAIDTMMSLSDILEMMRTK